MAVPIVYFEVWCRCEDVIDAPNPQVRDSNPEHLKSFFERIFAASWMAIVSKLQEVVEQLTLFS